MRIPPWEGLKDMQALWEQPFWETVWDQAPCGVMVVDAASILRQGNRHAHELLGYAAGELRGVALSAIIPVQHRNAHGAHEERFRAQPTGRPMGAGRDLAALRKDGTTLPVEVGLQQLAPLTPESGAATLVFMVDVSARHRLLRQWELAEARSRLLLEHATEAIVTLDPATGAFLSVNPATLRLLGLSREELTATHLLALCPPLQPNGETSSNLLRPKLAAALAGDEPAFPLTLLHAGGRLILGEMRLMRLPGEPTWLRASVVDITLRARAEMRYRALFDGANDGVVVLGDTGVVLECNRHLSNLMGLPKEHLIGHVFWEFLTRDQVAHQQQAFAQTLMQGQTRAENLVVKRPNGESLSVDVSTNVVEVAGEHLVLVILRDVTTQNQLRAQLQMSDRMVSVGTLAAGMAHEVNNPLAAVLTNLDLAQSDAAALKAAGALEHAPELPVLLEEARVAAERVKVIVRDLKVFSRAEDEPPCPVDVTAVLESSARMARNEIRHRARLEKDFVKLPFVLGSESRLGQVFLNLLVNAAHAIPEGRALDNVITLRTRLLGDGRVRVEIQDTGTGMDAATQVRLFTPFFTTKPPGVGTGLGLAISARIVMDLGGVIDVTSAPGLGTTLGVTLMPALGTGGQPLEPPTGNAPQDAPVARVRILLVDDEPGVGMALGRGLRRHHDVVVETHAAAALARLHAGEEFAVIISDLMMPHVSGMDLFEEVKAFNPALAHKMVFLTGGAFTTKAQEFLARVPNPRLDKPCTLKELGDIIATVLNRSPS